MTTENSVTTNVEPSAADVIGDVEAAVRRALTVAGIIEWEWQVVVVFPSGYRHIKCCADRDEAESEARRLAVSDHFRRVVLEGRPVGRWQPWPVRPPAPGAKPRREED